MSLGCDIERQPLSPAEKLHYRSCMRLLLNSDAGDGGTPTPVVNAPQPAADPPASAAPQPAQPPPAATAVVTGKKTEREVQLEKELEEERKRIKDRETKISELEDQNFKLKTGPRPQKEKRVRLTPFRFDD